MSSPLGTQPNAVSDLIPLWKAIVIGWAVDWDNICFKLGLGSKEFLEKRLDDLRTKLNIIQIRTPFEKLGNHRLILSINGEEVLIERHFTQIQQLRKLPFWPNVFAHQIRKSFREGSIDTFILDQNGGLTSLGAEYWSNESCLDALLRDARVRIPNEQVDGSIVLRFSDLKTYLTPPGQLHPLLRVWLAWDAIRQAADAHHMPEEEPSMSAPAAHVAEEASKGKRPRHRPKQSQVERVLRDLYPEGVPERDVVSDADLHRKVCAILRDTPPSYWTVRRAAGRAR